LPEENWDKTIAAINLRDLAPACNMKLPEMLIQGKGTMSTLFGRWVLSFEGLPHTAAQAWHRINKNSCIRICQTGNPRNAVVQELTNPAMTQ
jgi:hypothetical protein